jgi:predicted O-methyltransferase YrrM
MEEVASLCYILGKLNCKSMLEIGTREGFTLQSFGANMDKLVSVDLPYNPTKIPYVALIIKKLYRRVEILKLRGKDVTLIRGNSKDKENIQKATDLGPYDFVYIDGGHDYETVKSDWINYSPLANKIVAFHDIANRKEGNVPKFWKELKEQPGIYTLELIETLGTGVVFMNGSEITWKR